MLLNGSTMFGLVLIMCLLKNGANGQDLPRPLNGVRLYFNSSEFDDFSKHSSGDLSMGQELWCQTSANDTGPVGVWYYPNGTVIDDNSTTALRVMSANGQIGLYVMGTFTDQGLYSCVIPDENNISKTLVAAVYTDTEFNRAVAPNLTVPDFELLSSRDVDPPIFAINFTANERPPTEIVCYLNATLLDTMVYSYSRIVVSPLVPISVNVTVTFKTREAGNYSCEVTTNVFNVNLGKKPTTEPIIVAVPPTPVNVTSVRSSFETVTISWSTSSSSLEPSPNGYEVFYKIADDEETMIVDTRDTNATLDVEINHNYTVFVVAYYIDDTPSLPSAASEVIEIPQIISFDVSGPATTISYLSNTTLICEVTSFESAIDISSLQWFDPVGAEITANSNQFFIGSYINDDNTSASSDLEITNILLSQAGVYTCSVNLTIPADQVNRNELVLNLNEIHEIFIQVTEPSVSVTTSAITNGRIFDTGQVLFLCMVTLIGIDTNFIPNVTTSWFGPNGLVENDTNSIIDNQQLLEMQSDFNFYITLLINNLNITNDNNTTYTCSVSVGASMEFPRYEYIEPNSAADSSSPLSIEEFPDIDVLITIVGVPIIGEDIQLKCNITINDEDLLDNVTLGWLYNGDLFNDVTLVEQDDDYVAALTINSIDRINNGNYTCFGGLMLNGVQEMSTDSETLILVAVGNPSVNITSTGSSLADSSNYSLICTVLVDKGVPDVVWLDSNGSVIINNTETLLSLVVNGLVNILELQFATLEYSLAGEYTCQASLVLDIGDFDSSEIYVVNVEIPTPDVTIELSNSLAVPYEATQQMLTCTVSPISPLPNPLFIDIQWSMDNKPLDTDGVRLNLSIVDEYISTLTFSPAGTLDSGEYRCLVVISTNNPNIVNATESYTFNFTIQELLNPLIIFNASSTPFIGEELTLTCHIDTIDNLYNVNITSSIIIRDDSVTSIESLGDATVEFTYNPLMASSVGNYSCVTIITQLAINLNLSFNEEFVVSGIIPEPNITLSTDPIQNDALLEGTRFAITCLTIIDQSVDSEYNITINWVLNNNQNLSNTSKYSILPVTEVSSSMFENTLQINEIDRTDNNSPYTCIVSTVSDNEFLIDSTSNKSVVLGVTDFTSNDLAVSIVVVEPPQVVPIIAGETISLNCSVAVPVGFVSPPNNITFTYDVNGMESISANHTDAIQSSITSNSETVYSTTLTITSSKTSDARVYYCIAEFLKFTVMAVGNVSVSIQIPPPSVNITISPNSPIYESTRVNVTCIANLTNAVDTDIIPSFSWINPLGSDVATDNRIVVGMAQELANNVFQSILEFNPVDNGDNGMYNDSGSYTCQVLFSSNNDLILGVDQNDTFEIVVKDLINVTLTITYSGSVVIGENSTLNCNVNNIDELQLVGDVSLQWQKGADLNNVAEVVSNPTELVLSFNPLSYDDRGQYYCVFLFGSSITNDNISVSNNYSLTVKFPPPNDISIAQSQPNTIYAGTVLQLNCMILLSDLINAPITVSSNWTKDGNAIISTNSRIFYNQTNVSLQTYSSNLFFIPLNSSDSGVYQCIIDVSGDEYVTPSAFKSLIDVTVEGLLNPVVMISTEGNIELGSFYNLTCNVNVIAGLYVKPMTMWTKETVNTSLIIDDLANVIPEEFITINENTLVISIPLLKTSDSGRYTCTSEINIDEINVAVVNSSDTIVQVKIPTPDVSTNFSWGANDLSISCLINTSIYVNTDIQVNVGWSNQDGITLINNSRTTISQTYLIKDAMNMYRSDFHLISPTINDNNEYTCSAIIQPLVGYLYIDNSETLRSTANITVLAPSTPPDNFSVLGRTPLSLTFKWKPPSEPNGPIINYTLAVDYNNGTNAIISLGVVLSYTLNGLMPYQLINASISASTVEGPSPLSVPVSNRTLQDTPGPIANLSIDVVNIGTVIVSWSAVTEPNGVILHYSIIISEYEGTNIATKTNNEDKFNITINDLEGETPYRIVVFAVNEAVDSNGVPSEDIFFTVEGVPPAPDDIIASRVNGTHLNVSWIPIPLTKARGFIQGYTITYERQDALKRETLMKNVSSDQSNALIGGLDPIGVYNVQVAASTNAGIGGFSDSIPSEIPSMQRFQVRAGPFDNCTVINSSYDSKIKTAIRSKLVDVIMGSCNCDFTSSYINTEELTCITQNNNQLVYRANITQYNEDYTTAILIDIISEYISNNPTVSSQSLSFRFNSSCDILFESGEDVCGSVEGTTETVEDGSLLFIIIGAALGVLLALIVALIVIIVTCVIVRFRKKKVKSNQGGIELTGYTEIRRRQGQGDLENTAINGQQGLNSSDHENLYSELSTERNTKRTSELITLNNSLYAEADVVENPHAIPQTPLYADLTDVQEEKARVLTNVLYSLSGKVENEEERVLDNELYSLCKNEETEHVVTNILYGDITEVDNSGNGPTPVVNKQKKKANVDEVIENPGFEYAVVQLKKPTPPPPPPDLDNPTLQSDDQYEAPWSAKYRSLKRQSKEEYDDVIVKSKEKEVDDQYEAPWSAKYKSLSRRSATFDEGNSQKVFSTPPPLYDDTVIRKRDEKDSDDQYETPWSAKYRSLSRKSATFDEGNSQKVPSTPPPSLYDDTVIRKREEKDSDDQYETPWSAKYRSLSRKSGTFEECDKSTPPSNLYDDTVILKRAGSETQSPPILAPKPAPVSIQKPNDDTYEMPWRNKIGSLKRNCNSLDIPVQTDTPSAPHNAKQDKAIDKVDGETTSDSDDEGGFVLNEYETIHPSSIVSEYDKICIPETKLNGNVSPSNDSKPTAPGDQYFVPFDIRTKGTRPNLPPQNRQRVKSLPNKTALLTRTQTIPENFSFGVNSNDQEEYSIPFGSLNTGNSVRENRDNSPPTTALDDDIYSMPFDNAGRAPGHRSNTVSHKEEPIVITDEKSRHESVSEIDGKKQRKGILQALKLKKKENKSKINQPAEEGMSGKVEEIYETIDTLPRSSLISQDNYSAPVDAIKKNVSSTPVAPALPPSRLSVTDKSKEAFLKRNQSQTRDESTTSAISDNEDHTDPVDSLAKLKNVKPQFKSTHKIATEVNNVPLQYEIPIEILSKQSSVENLCSTESSSKENLSMPTQSPSAEAHDLLIKPYKVVTIIAETSRQESGVTTSPSPYEVPIGETPTSSSVPPPDILEDSKHVYEETFMTKENNEEQDFNPPTVPQPYETPVHLKPVNETNEPQSYEIPVSTKPVIEENSGTTNDEQHSSIVTENTLKKTISDESTEANNSAANQDR